MHLAALQSQPIVRMGTGGVAIVQGEPLRGLYFLETGELEVVRDGILIAEIHEPGAMIGEMSWLLRVTPTATVRATTPCTFRHVVDPESFMREHPEVALHIAATLARRLDSLAHYLVDIKNQFRDRADHLGMIDEVLDALLHKFPRNIPRRSVGD